MTAPTLPADTDIDETERRDGAGGVARAPGARPARPVTWRHAGAWCAAAALVVLITLVVVDNFVVVELRLPLAVVTARLGWIVVVAGALGFGTGWAAGRLTRRPAGPGSRRWRSGPTDRD